MLNKKNLPFPDINLSVMVLSSPIPPPPPPLLQSTSLLLPLNSSLKENAGHLHMSKISLLPGQFQVIRSLDIPDDLILFIDNNIKFLQHLFLFQLAHCTAWKTAITAYWLFVSPISPTFLSICSFSSPSNTLCLCTGLGEIKGAANTGNDLNSKNKLLRLFMSAEEQVMLKTHVCNVGGMHGSHTSIFSASQLAG